MKHVNCAKISLPTRQRASKTVTRSIASQVKFDASVDMYFLYPCRKTNLNMKELSFLLPTGSGIVTFRDYKLSSLGNKALSSVSRFKQSSH